MSGDLSRKELLSPEARIYSGQRTFPEQVRASGPKLLENSMTLISLFGRKNKKRTFFESHLTKEAKPNSEEFVFALHYVNAFVKIMVVFTQSKF